MIRFTSNLIFLLYLNSKYFSPQNIDNVCSKAINNIVANIPRLAKAISATLFRAEIYFLLLFKNTWKSKSKLVRLWLDNVETMSSCNAELKII